MASSSALVKLACALFVCMIMVAPHAEAAMSCGIVTSNVAKCIPYLMGGGNRPPPACCGGIKNLKNMASSPADRRTACNCLKSASRNMKNLNFAKAAGLPRSCGVSIPYAISPNTNCDRVN